MSHAGVMPAMPLELRKFFKNVLQLTEAIGFLEFHFGWGHHVSTIQQAVSAECQGLERCKSDAACLLKQS